MDTQKFIKITPDKFLVNDWSGGSTTQFAISPQNSTLANRNFDWRISSATFTSTSSKFSDFSGYQRYILPLRGNIVLNHQNLYKTELMPYEVEYFSGSWTTYSENSPDCRDFNLIVKEGIDCQLTVFSDVGTYIPKRKGTLILFSTGKFDIDVSYQHTENTWLSPEELLILAEEPTLHKVLIKEISNPVILCEIGD